MFTKKINHTANVFLAIAIIALSIDVFNSAYILFNYYTAFPHFLGVTFSFPFLYGPIFYLYAKLLSSNDQTFYKKLYLHFIPFIVAIIYALVFFYFKTGENKIELVKLGIENSLPGLEIINYLKPVHGIIYVILTIILVREYNKKIKSSYSNIDQINLDWLLHLTIGLSLIWGIVIFSYVYNEFNKEEIELDFLIYIAASVLIYSIGYLSLRQPQIFTQSFIDTENKTLPTENNSNQRKSYKQSGLKAEEAELHLNNLIKLMENEKPYLTTNLTLKDLADKLNISTHNLSEIINTQLNQNFYDFVNSYRVEEVKRKLTEDDSLKFSLIAIAFDSGFNSKSAFNSIFKKHTNVTPSQYRNQLK
ncbi:MAG: AraC family transcriptional regulator [Ignavibacteriae bacterium]|nr:AraC family transcriptional regulator [Ignavibacteriota bacterium]